MFDSVTERLKTLASILATAGLGLAVLGFFYALSPSVAQDPVPYVWGASAVVIVPIVVVFYLVGRRLFTKSRELDKKLELDKGLSA